MSRQRRRAESEATEAEVVKKRKMGVSDLVQRQRKEEVEVGLVEEEGSYGEGNVKEMAALLPWWPSEMIDEQMSWSMVWLPNWDAEFVGRAYHLLYGDVAWDDDIWGLKAIHEIPLKLM
uniref:Uncharacterized protein n=1 Tax=Kalanchoe fedtschenkoi TaxID=63787 RepID=A0A7N0U1M4_KALFE